MLRIAVGGLRKQDLGQAVHKAQPDAQVIITSDMNGAKLLKSDEVDYYFGACNSGGGAAISILIGLLGYDRCCTVCRNGATPDAEEIAKRVGEGKIVFGMTVDSIEQTVPMLVAACRRAGEHAGEDKR